MSNKEVVDGVPHARKSVLDRLVFTARIEEKDRQLVRKNLDGIESWKDGRYFVRRARHQKGLRYRRSLLLFHKRLGSIARFDFDPLNSAHSFLRVDLNPARLRKKDLRKIREFLRYVLLGLYTCVLARPNITAVHVAVDVDNERMGQLMMFTGKGVKSSIWAQHFEADGSMAAFSIETKYLGSGRSDNRATIYDRRARLKAIGKKSPANDQLRIEVRVKPRPLRIDGAGRKTFGAGATLQELTKIRNPFSTFVIANQPKAPRRDAVFALFLDSCRLRGEQAALGQLGRGRRERYRYALSRYIPTWWDPEGFWLRLPQLIRATGLFPEKTMKY